MSDQESRPVRFDRPERRQSEWRDFSLDQFIPVDHRVRVVWHYVQSLDLSTLEAKYKAVEGNQGRKPVDPRILLALWIYATTESVSSARAIDRKCITDLAYMWICGGVSVNYHLIADFRSQNLDFFQQTLVTTVASLLHAKIITLDTVAQDGMRTRANAGASSFRRKETLKDCVQKAKSHIERINEQEKNEEQTKAQQAAQERAAKEKLERAEESLRQVIELEQQREKRKKGTGDDARCSTTDPDARRMIMADGACRPGYNVQLATEGKSRIIVGVSVVNTGNDNEQMPPMLDQIQKNFGHVPARILVDTGFSGKAAVTKATQQGSEVFAPIYGKKNMEKNGKDPYERKKGDTDEYHGFRERMRTQEAKEIYKQRSSIAEFPNAELRNRGLIQFRVRGAKKVLASTLLYVLTYNFMRFVDLKLTR